MKGYGRVIKGVGGLFTVRLYRDCSRYTGEGGGPLDGQTVLARGRGTLHHKGALLVGDVVEVYYDEISVEHNGSADFCGTDGSGIAIDRVLDRTSALIRPPMANLGVLFVTFAAASPDPVPETVDKLISIAEFNHIEPVVVITKCDLFPDGAKQWADIYAKAGFEVFLSRPDRADGADALRRFVTTRLMGRVAAFAGASGVGKSTLLNRLYPDLALETGEISRRIRRGKNTTRCVELYPIGEGDDAGFLADTPGFTMLDFERFDFFEKEDLPGTFRDFSPYIGKCRYTKCSHTKEEGCAVLDAVRQGLIPKSRHESFVSLYEVLNRKKKW